MRIPSSRDKFMVEMSWAGPWVDPWATVGRPMGRLMGHREPAHGSAHEPSQNFFMFLFKIESLFDTLVFPNLQRKLPCLSSHESSQGVSYACFSIS